MKVYLMYKDRDFVLEQKTPWHGPDLIQDLQLPPVIQAMAGKDELLYQVAQSALLSGLSDSADEILYRHAVLKDCLKNPAVIKRLFKLAVSVIGEKKVAHWTADVTYSSKSLLYRAVENLKVFQGTLKSLRVVADEEAEKFESTGFTGFFSRIKQEITSEYLAEIEEQLHDLSIRDEILVGARLGKSNRGSNYILCKPNSPRNWLSRTFRRGPQSYTFHIDKDDENALRRLGELRNRGLDSVADTTARAVDHILDFLNTLRNELAFYLGCINLQDRLNEINEPTCFPVPAAAGKYQFSSEGLYDISLALSMGQAVVANDINAGGKRLIIVTGANKGGKTTFLRSVGLSQIMMHCGMFVPARSFTADLCTGLFTHFKRKEDVTLESGKLDDELNRMSQIVDHLSAGSLVLLNEAFASTNEKEGSEIARQIVTALPEKQVKVIFVSHLYHFTHELYKERTPGILFLRAERQIDGSRTYHLSEGEPLETSYGIDLYNLIFTDDGKEENAKVQ
jgi:DNA mismatch repair ATPase MutS